MRAMNNYAAVIYDAMNIVTRVEERTTRERAEKAGKFYTKQAGWWYLIVSDWHDIELYKALINA